MTNVLVTGAGGSAGIAVVRALVERGEQVVAVDTDPIAAGLGLAEKHAIVCPASEGDRFVIELAAIAGRSSADLVISTVYEEMLVLAGREHELGAPLWLPKRRAVAACVDRWRFWKIAEHLRIPAAPSLLGADAIGGGTMTLPGPWIVKPRFAGGSASVSRVDDPTELAGACDRIAQPIVQTRVSGREFTVDLLADRAGRLAGAVPRWHLETDGGNRTIDRTFCDSRVTAIAERVVAVFGLTGAANLNGFVTDDDEIVLVEVSPRFSGGISLSLAAGADLVGEYVRGALGLPIRAEHLQFRPDVTMAPHDTERFAA